MGSRRASTADEAPASGGSTAFAVTTTTTPAVASAAGRGCAPPLGLLRLSSILPAVRHRSSVLNWRGFSCSRSTSSAAEPAMPSDIDLVAGYEGLDGRRCRVGAPGRLAAWVLIRGGHFRAAGVRAGGGRSAGGPEGKPAVASAAGGGCGPLFGLLGLSSVLAAVRRRLSVVRWRGFSQAGGAKRAGGSEGWGRSARRRCVWVSARTGGGGLDGRSTGGRVLGRQRAERRRLRRSRAARRLGPPAGRRSRRRCRLRPQSGPGPLRRGRRPGGPRQRTAAWRARGGHGGPARGHRRCLR